MEQYTVGLALFDYLPVAAGGIGLYLVCRYCAGRANYSGPWIALIPLVALTGGAFKATWKLILAARSIDLAWMSDQLMFLLASAYVLMAVFVVRSLRAARNASDLPAGWWRMPAIASAAAVAGALVLMRTADGRAWAVLLVAVVAAASLVLLLALAGHALASGDRPAAAAFAASLALSYVLVGFSQMEQTVPLQWTEQSVNLAANCLLACGAWRLLRKRVRHG